jgi:hypothetical protein
VPEAEGSEPIEKLRVRLRQTDGTGIEVWRALNSFKLRSDLVPDAQIELFWERMGKFEFDRPKFGSRELNLDHSVF